VPLRRAATHQAVERQGQLRASIALLNHEDGPFPAKVAAARHLAAFPKPDLLCPEGRWRVAFSPVRSSLDLRKSQPSSRTSSAASDR
jgi:hypothetical protein